MAVRCSTALDLPPRRNSRRCPLSQLFQYLPALTPIFVIAAVGDITIYLRLMWNPVSLSNTNAIVYPPAC